MLNLQQPVNSGHLESAELIQGYLNMLALTVDCVTWTKSWETLAAG